ncbi:MAG: hypothetical protein ACFFFH_12050 [Candidatus Thorarchaeota archaeon]
MFYKSAVNKNMILQSIRLILKKYRSARILYNEIAGFSLGTEEIKFSYSQFTRYLKGEIPIPDKNENIFERFIHNNFNLATDLIQPDIEINIDAVPIQVDMSRFLSYPNKVNLLAYHVINQDHLRSKFDAILTHPEAIPLAISFSQILDVPWFSVTFRPPSVLPSRISQHPYLIDQELVRTAYFMNSQNIRKKNLLIVSDYVRRGGFLDILFRVTDDNEAEVRFLLAIIGIGNTWKRFDMELEGNMKVIHFV